MGCMAYDGIGIDCMYGELGAYGMGTFMLIGIMGTAIGTFMFMFRGTPIIGMAIDSPGSTMPRALCGKAAHRTLTT